MERGFPYEFRPAGDASDGGGKEPDHDHGSAESVWDLIDADEVEQREAGMLPRIPEKDARDIRDYFDILKIEGADEAVDAEIELIWRSVGENTSLVKDLVLMSAERNTRNNYCEFPLLPNIRDLLEIANERIDVETMRPMLIQMAVDNLEALQLNRDKCMALATGSNGQKAAEGMRLLGWIAGLPFMRGSYRVIREQNKLLEIDEEHFTAEELADSIFTIMSSQIDELEERGERSYDPALTMDRAALNFAHSEIMRAMRGIADLVFDLYH